MGADLQLWRKRSLLTQVEAAELLGVSQPYLSLLEKGARPVTPGLRSRLKVVGRGPRPGSPDGRFRGLVSGLGYPGFAHVAAPRVVSEAGTVLLAALAEPDLDARVTESLPWVARRHAPEVDWPWLVRQAKLRDLQNRLGFLIEIALTLAGEFPPAPPLMAEAKDALEKARLLAEATFCWDSMPPSARRWMRQNRSKQAAHWNVVTRMRAADLSYAQ